MTEYIKIGGKLRPVSFAYRQQRIYEEEYSRPLNKDLQILFAQLAPIQKAVDEKDEDGVVGTMAEVSIVLLGNIFYSAFLCGANLEKTTIDFDVYDVTDWIFQDTTVIEKLVKMLVSANSSTVKQENSLGAKKKK